MCMKNHKQLIHDIKNHFSVINGFLKAVGKVDLPKEYEAYYKAALNSAEKLKSIIAEDVKDTDKNKS